MRWLATLGLFALAAAGPLAAEPAPASKPAGQMFKSATCDCCSKWQAYMAKNGYALESKEMSSKDLHRFKVHIGLTPDQSSCHTAMIDGYAIEGHVPADDVTRLLKERPEAIGLSVPKMPVGTPGMEQGDQKDPYEVLLIKKDGTTEVWSKH